MHACPVVELPLYVTTVMLMRVPAGVGTWYAVGSPSRSHKGAIEECSVVLTATCGRQLSSEDHLHQKASS